MFAFWSSCSHKLLFYGAENVGFTVADKVCRHCFKWLCVYAKCVNMCLDVFIVLFSLRILLMSMCLMLRLTPTSLWTSPPMFAYDVTMFPPDCSELCHWECCWHMLSMFLGMEGVLVFAICDTMCDVIFRMSAMRKKTEQMRGFWAPISLQGVTQRCLSCLI